MTVKALPNNIDILIVNYFSSSDLSALLPELEKSTSRLKATIRCVDNSANDAEHHRVETLLNAYNIDYSLRKNSSNTGFASAVNLAACAGDSPYLLLLNPDVRLENSSIETLLEAAGHSPDNGVWGPITVDENGLPDFRHAWREPSLLRTLAWASGFTKVSRHPAIQDAYTTAQAPQNSNYSVDAVSGCCLLVRRDLWERLGGFDERFFLYSEEIDLCRRARDLQHQPTVVTKARIQHARSPVDPQGDRLSTMFRSKMLYMQKHHGAPYTALFRVTLAFGASLRWFAALLGLADVERRTAWKRVAIEAIKWPAVARD